MKLKKLNLLLKTIYDKLSFCLWIIVKFFLTIFFAVFEILSKCLTKLFDLMPENKLKSFFSPLHRFFKNIPHKLHLSFKKTSLYFDDSVLLRRILFLIFIILIISWFIVFKLPEFKTINFQNKEWQFYQKGTASYYGKKFAGRPTASGEIFYPSKISAAHKKLPLGKYVLVENLKNNKKLTVKINDRGPYKGSRIIDMSKAAAEKLGYQQEGLTKVIIYTEKQ